MKTLSPAVITLPWRQDAAERYFSTLSHLPWAMLLHSGQADHPHNRFDILVADPVTTLVTRATETVVQDGHATSRSLDDPMTVLHSALIAHKIHPEYHPDLPFQGGALGLFGYDLGRRFESLPTIAERDITLPDMAVGIYDWALIVDHQLQTVSLLSHTDVEARLKWLDAQQPPTREPFTLTSAWQSNMSRAQYGEKFRQVQDYLHSGDCYQVNLAQRFQAHYQGDEWQAFVTLNHANRAPFSAFIRLEEGAILSLSPERFILLENQHIQTRPIKGTLPRLGDTDADREQARRLANSPKDRAENLMIVDLMRNDIGRVAVPGSVQVPELFIVEPFPCRSSFGQHHYRTSARVIIRHRSATRRLPRRLYYRRAESAGDGNYRRTGAAKTQRLVRQHWLSELLRQYGYQHYHSHADSHKRTNLLLRRRWYCCRQSGRR